jgi:hypothetical protein
MSGQPLKSPSDASKYRQQYLATLALQANINDANLQANKIYKRTGQTPTQPTDMRLTSEKLADIERLKIEVRAQLAGIMDGEDAQEVITNLTPGALQFVAQNINQIVKEVKPQYQLGMPALAFERWLDLYMMKANEINEVAYGLQQNAGVNVMMGAEQIRELINAELLRQVGEVMRRLDERNPMRRIVKRRIDDLEPIVALEDKLTEIGQIADTTARYGIQQALNNIFNNLPLQSEVKEVLNSVIAAIDRKDERLTDVYVEKLDNLLAVEPSAVADAERVREVLDSIEKDEDYSMTEIGYGGGGGEPKPKKKDRDFGVKLMRYEDKYGELNPYRYDGRKKSNDELLMEIDDALKLMPYGSSNESRTARAFYINVMGGNKSSKGPLTGAELRRVYNRVIEELTNYREVQSYSSLSLSPAKPERVGDEPISVKQGKGIAGRKKITPVIDYTKGVLPVSNYIPFGKVFINTDKLKSGIISVRKGKGVHITAIPVKRVSHHLNDVINKIVGGGSPSYTQLSKLNSEEHKYLYDLGRHSGLLDKIGVEAPTKSDDDADINQFEIYKGQLMSGNDSTEMVADFKKLIVKMIGKKLLPRGQAKLILLDLTEMGY